MSRHAFRLPLRGTGPRSAPRNMARNDRERYGDFGDDALGAGNSARHGSHSSDTHCRSSACSGKGDDGGSGVSTDALASTTSRGNPGLKPLAARWTCRCGVINIRELAACADCNENRPVVERQHQNDSGTGGSDSMQNSNSSNGASGSIVPRRSLGGGLLCPTADPASSTMSFSARRPADLQAGAPGPRLRNDRVAELVAAFAEHPRADVAVLKEGDFRMPGSPN